MAIAVIGAGPAGLLAARVLQAAGEAVTVFDKGRGMGGRMATRRHADGVFDHGVPAFGVADETWRSMLSAWHRGGVCAPIEIDGERCWTGVGGMTTVGRWLGDKLDVRSTIQIARIAADGSIWDGDGQLQGRYTSVLVTAPAPQALEMTAESAPDCAEALQQVVYSPCWTLMARLRRPPQALAGMRAPIAQAVREAEKPGRSHMGECWVAHADAIWSQVHLEETPEAVQGRLLSAFCDSTGLASSDVFHARVHRWRYARVERSLAGGYLCSAQAPIMFAGDYLCGDGVEAAFRSGEAAAAALLADRLNPD